MKKKRGYLLIEVMVGGIVGGVALLGLLVQIEDAHERSMIAGRDITAAQLCQRGLEISRADIMLGVPVTSGAVALPPGALNGTYTSDRVVSTGSDTIGTQSVPFTEVTMTVTYPTHRSGTRTKTMATRVYDP